MTLRRGLLVAFLALGAGALAPAARVESEAPAPVIATPAQPNGGTMARESPRAAPRELDTGSAFREQPLPDAPDVFQPRSWAPPPPPAVKAPPPPAPVAPPLPFAFLGRMEDGGDTVVFLSRGDVTLPARAREQIDAQYRLEAIGPQSLVITYLPLGQQQVLAYGSVR